MVKVTEAIKKILKQKQAELLDGAEANRRLLANLERQIRADLGQSMLSDWNSYHLRRLLDQIEKRIADYDTAAKKDLGERMTKTWNLGQASVYAPLEAAGIYTGFHLSNSVLKTLEDFAFHKLSNVSNAVWDKVRGELTLGSLGAKTPQEVANAIAESGMGKVAGNKKIKKIFPSAAARAEFVTKTELGRVFSEAANLRREQAAKYVTGMIKVWRHGHPKQSRPVHLANDGVSVPWDKPFPIRDKNGYRLMRPHDPDADFSEVAGCQCDAMTWNTAWGEYKAA